MKKSHTIFSAICLGVLAMSQLSPAAPLPVTSEIRAVMEKPRYDKATWSLLVTDVDTGEEFYPLNEETLTFTGSTRKLFSVGLALLNLGTDHRFSTEIHRRGEIGSNGVLKGDLILVASGDLVFGGRRIDQDIVQVTDFDHNDANNLGTADLTPQDPLFALDQLAAKVKQSGIGHVTGDVVIDDRLFQPYRVPNQNLLITPIMLNENQIDVSVTPTKPGQKPYLDYRPQTAYFQVKNEVTTGESDAKDTVEFSDDRLASKTGGTGTVSGTIPLDYKAPMSEDESYVGTFRVEDPNSFARIALIEALNRQGVKVDASLVSANPESMLPAQTAYHPDTEVAKYVSAPYGQVAKLVLKVSLNLGANLSLSLFGLEHGESTIEGALAAERRELTEKYGLDPKLFNFPTNGSGSPDSQAAPKALVQWLVAIRKSPVGEEFQKALPIMGVDGSLASTGTTLSGSGQVFAKTGTTVSAGEDGKPHLKAQCLAGYIETSGGRRVAYALMVNDAGPLEQITDVTEVFEDQAVISNHIYETL
jgi:PBP4 family serine-type D-alanyl-D-alanine carboxypeptidase